MGVRKGGGGETEISTLEIGTKKQKFRETRNQKV